MTFRTRDEAVREGKLLEHSPYLTVKGVNRDAPGSRPRLWMLWVEDSFTGEMFEIRDADGARELRKRHDAARQNR